MVHNLVVGEPGREIGITVLRSERMRIVVKLASDEEEAAASIFEEKNHMLTKENERMDELREFYASYESKMLSKKQGVNINEIRDARVFLERLAQVQKGQQLQIQQAQRDVEHAKLVWHQCYLKKKNLVELVSRYREGEQVQIDKMEQKIMDDWVTQTHRPTS